MTAAVLLGLGLLGDVDPGTLADRFSAYWEADEVGGNRVDEVAAVVLAQVGTVGSRVGVGNSGLAADLSGSASNYLSGGDIFRLASGSFTIVAWVKLDTLGSTRTIVGKWQQTGNKRGWLLDVTSANLIQAQISTDGVSGQGVITASTFGAVVAGIWNFVVMVYDQPNDDLKISVNLGAWDTDSAVGGNPFASDADFRVGLRANGTNPHDGGIAKVGIAPSVLSTQDLADIYMGGLGNTWPFTGPVTLAGLTVTTSLLGGLASDTALLGSLTVTAEVL